MYGARGCADCFPAKCEKNQALVIKVHHRSVTTREVLSFSVRNWVCRVNPFSRSYDFFSLHLFLPYFKIFVVILHFVLFCYSPFFSSFLLFSIL